LREGRKDTKDCRPALTRSPRANTQRTNARMNVFAQQRILELPEQYNWMHKRLKTRPPGEAKLYQ